MGGGAGPVGGPATLPNSLPLSLPDELLCHPANVSVAVSISGLFVIRSWHLKHAYPQHGEVVGSVVIHLSVWVPHERPLKVTLAPASFHQRCCHILMVLCGNLCISVECYGQMYETLH